MEEKDEKELLQEIEEYNKKIEENPNNATYYNNRGISYFKLENYKKSVKDYSKAIELDPNDAVYYYNRGLSHFKLENYEKSVKDYSKAIESNPNNAVYYYSRGRSYVKLEEYVEAIKDYSKAIELNLNYSSAYNGRGILYAKLEEYEKAKKDYSKAIELNPNDAVYYYNRGITYTNMNKYEKAIKDYSKAIELDSENTAYYNNRGFSYFKFQKYEDAIKDYSKAIELDSRNALYYCNRGLTYLKLKKYKEANQDYNTAMELNPVDGIYKKLKNLKEIIENNSKSIELSDSNILSNEFKKEIFEQTINNDTEKSKNSEDSDERPESQMYNDAVNKHLNAKKDEDFEDAEKEFNSFIEYANSIDEYPELKNNVEEAKLYKIASKEKVYRLKGYLIFADILGWKGIWKKREKNAASILISIKKTLEKEKIRSINLISDTFIICSEDYKVINKIAKKLMEICLENDFPLRGAISYGECYNKDTVYVGPAIDETASWHNEGEEIGIFYTPSAKKQIEKKGFDDIKLKSIFLIEGSVKIKSGKIKTFFIDWYNEKTEENFYNIFEKIDKTSVNIYLKYLNTEENMNIHFKK